MSNQYKTEVNAAGREVLVEINGEKHIPFRGVNGYKPTGKKAAPPIRSCTEYPWNGDKRVENIKEALKKAGLKDGMTISTHHHLRNGDYVAHMVFDAAAELGVKKSEMVSERLFSGSRPYYKTS